MGDANVDDADASEDKAKFYFYLVNRPVLVLKCEQGFVGYKAGGGSSKLECNKATYETIQVERAENGTVYFKGEDKSLITPTLIYFYSLVLTLFIPFSLLPHLILFSSKSTPALYVLL